MNLKQVRERSGMTQRQASEASGIPLGTLRRWEQGVNEPDAASIVLLADLYGVSTDEILGSPFALAAEYSSEAIPADEQLLLSYYRRCSPQGRVYLLQVAEVTAGLFGGE